MTSILILLLISESIFCAKQVACNNKKLSLPDQISSKKILTQKQSRGLDNLGDLHIYFSNLNKAKTHILANQTIIDTELKIHGLKKPSKKLTELLKTKAQLQSNLDALTAEENCMVVYLQEKKFDFSNYAFEKLDHLHLEKVSLINCYFPCVSFVEANLSSSDLSYSTLQQANFFGATLINTTFKAADLLEASFQRANIENADFSKANISYANFMNTNLVGASLCKCIAEYTIFMWAKMQKCNLSNIIATNSNFCLADLTDANFENSNLTNTRFDRANVSNAIFFGATGLDDTQKNYLRTHGAANVPD
jgi:uncharacterized protein YjbI with pentapeptide repeats